MRTSKQEPSGRITANAATSDDVARDRSLRGLALALLLLGAVKFLAGEALFEQIWLGLCLVIFGVAILMGAGILTLWICFGETKIRVWLSPAHRGKQNNAFILSALISAGYCYHYWL